MVSIPLLRDRAVKFFIPLLRGDKGVCQVREQTHPLPPLKRGFFGICIKSMANWYYRI